MAYDENLAERIRTSLASARKVVEKKMFRGIVFMVNDKMCVCLNPDGLMCRIGPGSYDKALEENGVRPVIMRNSVMKGYVYVSKEVVGTKKQLDRWVGLCLDFNKTAKSSKKKTIAAGKNKA
jgi:TfoX/Sxy family transcriptional regulator of competence genes